MLQTTIALPALFSGYVFRLDHLPVFGSILRVACVRVWKNPRYVSLFVVLRGLERKVGRR